MAIKVLHIILVTLAVSSVCVNNMTFAYSNNFTDQQALLSVKSWITGDPLGVLSSWNRSIHFCQWKGVICSRRRQRVIALNLSSQKLQGMVSPHIGNLTFLRLINFTDNNFHGYIPNEVGRLFRLRYLVLDRNSFQADFPRNLSHCVDIRTISLFSNNLQGKLPTNFASWSKLNVLNLALNHFSGTIPPSIGNISSLRVLILGKNNLTGNIPLEVGNLLKLEFFQLAVNKLSGVVPLPLYNISSITKFSIGENQLTGVLPSDMGITLPHLQALLVSSNKFSGPFPTSIMNASNLVFLDISSNKITGPVPINLGTSLPKLELLNLETNPLGHKGDFSFFNSLVNCTRLNSLTIAENGLRGKLPNSIVNLSTTLQQLDLVSNDIYGSIPKDIGKLVNLIELSLSDSDLTGRIPDSIGQLSMLGQLYLYENGISGAIPASISNLSGLLLLGLDTNMLQGSIPTALFNISTLLGMDLSVNHLSGVIPEVSGLSSLSVGLYLNLNQFTGPLPSNIGNLKHVVVLSVSNNRLTGEIPDSLGDCSMLEELYMDSNLFEGRIPSSLKALKSLKILDLSNNNMSGNIPNFLGGFHLMKNLNLSHNKYEGEVPKEGAFSNLSTFSVYANLKLCGGIQALHLPVCSVNIARTKENKISLRILLLVVLLPVVILLACLALFFYRIKMSKQKNIPISVSQDNQYPRVSYHDLLLATSAFSRDNLLGEGRYGSVYRGVLESLQQTVAIKVLNVEVHGADKSFLSECGALRNIRHRNLIKIITACSSTDFNGNNFKALVFEFMTNGSLDNWLHPSPSDEGNERSLTLLQRLNISIDVALGVDYLHHRSHTRIIHCDIKPSNILLDEEFVARVGDFGLARFFPNTSSDINQAQTSSTGIRGTVGYVPPEYGMGGEISTEGDVYSYGILLLEMFSGKKPTGRSISMENANNLHDYVSKALPHRVLDIADPRIILQNEDHASIQVCLATIFEVGKMCSVENPKERIDISVALRQLHVARDLIMRRVQ